MLWKCKMDQQIAVSYKAREYGATTESKTPSVLGVTKSITMQEESGPPSSEASKICGSKRTIPDRPVSSSNSGNRHLVYVRRRPEMQMKESSVGVPETIEIPKPSVVSSSSSSEKCNTFSSNFGNAHSLDTTKRAKLKQWEERCCQLQNVLNSLDQSKQEDYIQMLRSLSSVELSKHAVELEKRSIQLAFEEGKEMRWVKVLDVMGKDWKSSAC
ncbi:unnamed protein product [Cuscuta epithymum]|uniref:Uncharacterized protein n=1 Tax=Cuscuta epithymum TaxID=186058 RepID=A0AAV0E753_9ASTE|nr:unnamed protein product [Cuscuta epithymum]